MQLIHNFQGLSDHLKDARQSSVTIGNFDGFHRGHQALWQHVLRGQKKLQGCRIGITFDPHPRQFFEKEDQGPSLFTTDQKARAFAEANCDLMIVQDFNEEFAAVDSKTFLEHYLLELCQAGFIVVGRDFRFGSDRSGDCHYLKQRCEQLGVMAATPEDVDFDNTRISSSRIRALLTDSGDMTAVNAMLGHPFLLEGTIVKGDQLGRKLGFPTANLATLPQQLLPAFGVYAGQVWVGESPAKPSILSLPKDCLPAVFNIGQRPTIATGEMQLRVEAHILHKNISEPLYGRSAGFYLQQRLRPEIKFADTDALRHQISKDIDTARAFFDDETQA